MAVPDFQTLMLPALRLAAKGPFKAVKAVSILSEEFHLSEDDRSELIPSGRQTRMFDRVSWAITYLNKAGLVRRPQRGYVEITVEGKKALAQQPEKITIAWLKQFPAFQGTKASAEDLPFGGSENDENNSREEHSPKTPEERIDGAIAEIDEALREELIDHILTLSPRGFEKLIIDVMLGMGYGARGFGQHLGQTGDGGVDGLISEDILGLDVIYLQAKRYKRDRGISVEDVNAFVGALVAKNASKGVFVTTSYFTRSAKEYKGKMSLVLIDGDRLADLMIRYGIGVRNARTVEIKKLDMDYFGGMEIPL